MKAANDRSVGSPILFTRLSGAVDAPAVVFLHGVGNTGAMWQHHMDALSDFHRVAPDLPGHGGSASISWSSRSTAAAGVIRIIEGLPAGRAHLVGLSLGGSVGLEILANRPDLLDRVVIDGCSALGTPLAIAMKLGVTLVSPLIRSPIVGRLVARGLGIDDPAAATDLLDQLGQVDPRSFRRAFSDAQDVRITEQLVRAPCPALLVAGEKELAHVRESNRRLADLMPNAEAWMKPGAGHGWLGSSLEVHVSMVRAWLEERPMPSALRPDGPRNA